MPVMINGVEYFQTPIPSNLWRVTEYSFAEAIVKQGRVRFSNASKYICDPDPERGDPSETNGLFIRQGIRCRTGYINPIFLWCATLESNPESLLAAWKDCDTVININNPQALAARMLAAAKAQGFKGVSFHAGLPIYDKDEGGTATYNWAESIFQKPNRYEPQKEYRFALVGECTMAGETFVDLTLGPCSDIVSIVKRR